MDEKNKEILNILDDFKFKIKKSLLNTSYQEREDLEQEIKAKIIERIHLVDFDEVPGFWDFIEGGE